MSHLSPSKAVSQGASLWVGSRKLRSVIPRFEDSILRYFPSTKDCQTANRLAHSGVPDFLEIVNHNANGIVLTSGITITGACCIKAMTDAGIGMENVGRDTLGHTLLHCAARHGLFSVTAALIAAGVDIEAPASANNYRPLHAAATGGNIEIVQILINNNVDVNSRATFMGAHTNTALAIACSYCHTTIVKILLNAGAKTDVADYQGNTPLYIAAQMCTAAVPVLIDVGANPNAVNNELKTALHRAALSGNVSLLHLLVYAGAVVDALDVNGRSALHYAAISGDSESIQYMLEHLDVDFCGKSGMTSLHIAAATPNNAQIVLILLNAGADVNALMFPHITPLNSIDPFVDQSAEQKAVILLKYGADPNSYDRCVPSQTPLHKAVESGALLLVATLLHAGADPDLTEDNGYNRTALHLAVEIENQDIVKLLLEAGANKNVFNSGNKTPFEIAEASACFEIAQLLQTT